MDIKKAQSSSSDGDQILGKQNVQEFVSGIKSEIFKVHWTSREELIAYAKIVVVATFIFGIGIYFTDLAIQTVLNGLGFFVRLILG